MRVIPAIDIIGGKCVRLSRGDFSTVKEYHGNPVDTAKMFEDAGLKYLHLVDLDGAREGRVVNYKILERIAASTSMMIDFGGGIRSEDDLRAVFEHGAMQVNCGSVAVTGKEEFLRWLNRYGPEKIILSADTTGRKVAINGWQSVDEMDIIPFIKEYSMAGIEYVTCTDTSRDGMMEGPATELYREILLECKINLIASGGVRSVDDLRMLSGAGCEGAIVGKSIYEGFITLKELTKYAEEKNNTMS